MTGPSPGRSRANGSERLFAVQSAIQLELNQTAIGTTAEVLVDGPAKRGADLWQGRGDDGRVVNFPAWHGIEAGQLVRIAITGASAHSLAGELEGPAKAAASA